jgi:hypothetical protein
MFFRGSRYQDVPTLDYQDRDGRIIRHQAIRFIPDTPRLVDHVTDEGQRLDHIAFDHYRDPERFWRICDANLAVHPEELTAEPRRVLHVPPSEG